MDGIVVTPLANAVNPADRDVAAAPQSNGEHEQIGHTERGSPSCHNHKRILGDNVGPTGRNLPQSAGVVVEINAMASPAVAVRDELVLPSEQRVIWMRNPERFTLPGGISCSLIVLSKGRKERCLPLWKETASAVRAWLSVRGAVRVPELFLNARNDVMTRAGFEYILRKHVHAAETIAERVYAPLTAAILKPVDGDSRLDSTKLTKLDRAYQSVLTSLDRLAHELGLQAA